MTRHISRDEFLKLTKKPAKRGKYGNIKVKLDGFTFDSKAEAKYYEELKLMAHVSVNDGGIADLVIHPGWDLGSCYYKADFSYFKMSHNDSWLVVCDVKGRLTPDCKIKLRLMREKYGIEVKLLTKETDPRLFR